MELQFVIDKKISGETRLSPECASVSHHIENINHNNITAYVEFNQIIEKYM